MRKELYLAKAISISCRTIDGTAYILRENVNELLQLNEVGTHIWDQINGLCTLGEIIQTCLDRYEGDHAEIKEEILRFVSELLIENIAVSSELPFEGVMQSA